MLPAPSEETHAALDRIDSGERGPDLEDLVQPFLEELLSTIARNLLEAHVEHLGGSKEIKAALRELDTNPGAAWRLAPARSLASTVLGAEQPLRDYLDQTAEGLTATTSAMRLSGDEVREALHGSLAEASQVADAARARRRYRLDAVQGAGTGLRAAMLSADAPTLRREAEALLAQEPDSPEGRAATCAAFESLVAQAGARAADAQLDADQDPNFARAQKRRFTVWHAAIAALIVGLFCWHYLLR